MIGEMLQARSDPSHVDLLLGGHFFVCPGLGWAVVWVGEGEKEGGRERCMGRGLSGGRVWRDVPWGGVR